MYTTCAVPRGHMPRGGHSHTRNAFGRDRGHKVVTETLALFLVVTGSQDISGSGHGVTGIFLGAVCIILISDSCHSIQHSLAMHTYSHASEEHVRLIMRVEHRSDGSDRLAHGKEYALARYLLAPPHYQ